LCGQAQGNFPGGLFHRPAKRHGEIVLRGHRRIDKAGADQSHGNAFAGQVDAQGLHQVAQGRLGCAVGFGAGQGGKGYRAANGHQMCLVAPAQQGQGGFDAVG
jgi:hypothetical protein